MKRGVWLVVVATPIFGALAAQATGGSAAADGAPPLKSESSQPAVPAAQPQDFYALGVLLSHNLEPFDLSEKEFKRVLAGVSDGYHQRAHLDQQQNYLGHIMVLQTQRQIRVLQRSKEAGAAYVDKIAALPGARRTPSGLVYAPSAEGNGAMPKLRDRVKVQYTGKLIDGTVFDSTNQRGEPANLAMVGIIPCWKEALQLMRVGGRARVVCPAELAYGDTGSPPLIPPSATLDFQIELLDVTQRTAPPKSPSVTAPAASQSPASTPLPSADP
jgi:FKBP-type peptidyl-prolyl cis-trans isomerase